MIPGECGFLQTVPSDLRWGDSMERWGHTKVRQMIGEAVPPRFTKLHGRVLAALAQGRETLSQDDMRCQRALVKLGAGGNDA